jgi:hypothetical protein
MFKIKTPHRRPLRHLLNMFGLFTFGAAATVGLHLGALVTAGSASALPIMALVASALTAGAISLLGGVLVTATVRRVLNLVQTGRVIQYTGFTLASLLGLKLAAYFFASITLTAPLLAGFSLFAIAFGLATAFGEVPWRGRTWLPMRSKKAPAKPADKAVGESDKNPNKKS